MTVAEFLSPAWVAELDAALRTLDAEPSGTTNHDEDHVFVVEQRVRRAGAADHAHHLVARGRRFRAVVGPASAPDLIITTDLQTAIAIQRGAMNAQTALSGGHLRLGGDLDRLRARSELFASLDDVFAALRADTTYPDEGGAGTPR